MKFLKAVIGIGMIFILGVMTGVLGTTLFIQKRIDTFHEKGPPPIKPMFQKRIIDRLDLRPDQRLAVEKILDDLQIQLREMRQEFHPKIKAAFDASFKDIREILNDTQKKQLDKLLKDMPDHFPPHRWFKHKACDQFDRHHRMPPDNMK